MAQGLREGDEGAHLMTYHPAGEETSAQWFPDDPWLDFHVYQSGHAQRFHPVQRYADSLGRLQPRKPYLDAEPPYEDLPIRFWDYLDWTGASPVPASVLDERGLIARREHFAHGFFDDHDVRVHAYWNLLAGAAGFTYGHNAVWQMRRPGQSVGIPCLQGWREALESPGARQIRHVRTLFEQRSFTRLRPAPSLIAGANLPGARQLHAAVDERGEFALIYLAVGRTVELAMGQVRGAMVNATWFDPRTGLAVRADPVPNEGTHSFTPPTQGERVDWMLVLDAAGTDLPPLPATSK
jgi:hypothetical protein